MTAPSLPTGFDVSKHVRAGRSDCQLTVGFDRRRSHIPRFLVQLHYQAATEPVRWDAIARMDHNETALTGHDVYQEGLHVDVSRRAGSTVHLLLSHGPLPRNRGAVIRGCVDYLADEVDYFIDVYEGRHSPGSPPKWSDGGERTPKFIRPNAVEGGMSRESPTEDALTSQELTDLLAESTDSTPAVIDQAADDLEIAPPDEATILDED